MILLLFILYAISHGVTNAVCYSQKGAHALTLNEHILFVVERGLFVAALLLVEDYGLLPRLFEIVAGIFAFSWFHNGGYYIMRSLIARDGRHWWDSWQYQSETDTSKYSFDFRERTLLLTAGLVLLTVSYTLYYILR